MSNVDFSYNLFSLRLGSVLNPVSVLGFHSSIVHFNSDYECEITVKRFSDSSLTRFLNERACLSFGEKNQQHFLCGIVTKIIDNQSPCVLADKIMMHSPLFLLDITPKSAVYADMDLSQLVISVLEAQGFQNGIDFQMLCQQRYPVRQYIVQYQETPLAFIQRQCAKWGVFFSFVQKEDRPLLVFCDDIAKFSQQFISKSPFLNEIRSKRLLLAKTVSINDYNPESPSLSLAIQNDSTVAIPSVGVDYRPYEHYFNKEEGAFLLRIRMEALDCCRERIIAITDDVSLQVGQTITSQFFGNFYVIEMAHNAEVNSMEIPHNHYLRLTLLSASLPYRPIPSELFNMPDCLAVITSEMVDDKGCYFISPLFDERHLQNSYPVRLSQPYSGNNVGFHFPLQKGITVLISHINGDPDRPVIMGVIPNENSLSPVSALNSSQQILQTPKGNQMIFDDESYRPQILLSTPGQEVTTTLNANKAMQAISLASQKNVILQASKEIHQSTNAFFIQTINRNHLIRIKNQHQITTQQGDIILQSGKDLTSIAANIQIKSAQNINMTANKTIQCQAENALNLSAGQINFNANQGNIRFEANQLNLQSQGKIIISQSGSTILFDENGVTINAKKVNFNTTKFVAPPIQMSSKNTIDPTEKIKQTNLKLTFQNEFGELMTEDNQSGSYHLFDSTGNVVWAGGLLPTLSHFNLTQQNLTLSHSNIAVLSVNHQQGLPSNHYLLSKGQVSTEDNIETEHIALQTIHHPVYKIISPVSAGSYRHVCESITKDEIKYFQQNGNNVTIFIHGYNVSDGQYPGSEIICDANGAVTAVGNPWYFNRTYEDVQQSLQNKITPAVLEAFQKKNGRQDEHFDEAINGIGAHNWLLHIEYNLNCAAAGAFPFPWREMGLKFSRLLFVRWAGDVGNNTFEKGLNFGGAELNALAAANALVPVIHQLSQSGISINIIAHSLGNLVLIKLMDILGRQNQCLFDTAIMWQPAIANTALSFETSNDMETHIRSAGDAPSSVTKDMTLVAVNNFSAMTSELASAGLSFYGDYLKVQSAKINDPSHRCSLEELYDKDPFAYFPYAYQSANKINVLYGANDDVLKFDYITHDVFSNISRWEFIHKAMGLVGPDKKTQTELGKKLNSIDQKDWLQSHSDMRIPSADLFNQVYKKFVINEQEGINKFGRYCFT